MSGQNALKGVFANNERKQVFVIDDTAGDWSEIIKQINSYNLRNAKKQILITRSNSTERFRFEKPDDIIILFKGGSGKNGKDDKKIHACLIATRDYYKSQNKADDIVLVAGSRDYEFAQQHLDVDEREEIIQYLNHTVAVAKIKDQQYMDPVLQSKMDTYRQGLTNQSISASEDQIISDFNDFIAQELQSNNQSTLGSTQAQPKTGPVLSASPIAVTPAAPFPRAMGNQPVLAVDACRRAIDAAAAAGKLNTTWNNSTCTVSDNNTMLSTIEVKNGRLRQQLPLGASAGSITSQARIAALGLLALCGGKTSNVGINLRFDQHCDLEQTKALAFAMFAVLAQECPGKQIVLECGTMQADIERMYQDAYQESYQDMTARFEAQNPEDDRAQQLPHDEQDAQLNSESEHEPPSQEQAQQQEHQQEHQDVELNAYPDNSSGQYEESAAHHPLEENPPHDQHRDSNSYH